MTPSNKEWLLTKRIEYSWQKLADTYGLTFLMGEDFRQANLFGTYKHCYFDLKIENGAETRLTVTFERGYNPSPETFSPLYLERLLTLTDAPFSLAGQVDILADHPRLTYKQASLEYRESHLRYLFRLLRDLLRTYPALLEADQLLTDLLQDLASCQGLTLQPLAKSLLQDMKVTDSEVMALLCLDCIARYEGQTKSLFPLNQITPAGCRLCRKRYGYFVGRVMAVLDHTLETEQLRQDDTLHINWFKRRTLFDFDTIHLIAATDEEVERFAVQAGNDTDPFRRARYKQIPCLVAPTCHLLENTWRVLQHTFGTVHPML